MKTPLLLAFACMASASAFAQITITGTTSTPSGCSNNGSATVSISGGMPVYCFQINGGACQYAAGTTYTFTGLYSGSYTVTVSDGDFTASTSVSVGGNYSEPSVFANIIGCGVTAQASGGLPPYQYAISMGGGAFSAPSPNPSFSPVTGNYCVRAYDACNNFTQYCGTVNVSPLDFQALCCFSNVPPDQTCVTIHDPAGNTIFSPSFWLGGLPPYTFTATANGQTVSNSNGLFNLGPACPGWTFTVTDACGNSVSSTANCLEASVLCVNCSDGTAQVQGAHGTPPYQFFYQNSVGQWLPNPAGVNSGNFSGLQTFPNGTGVSYAFSVIDACGNASPTLWAQCLDAATTFNCATGQATLTPQTEYFPATVTCTSCIPPQSQTVQAGQSASFSGLNGVSDAFTVTDACGATITKNCWTVEPDIETHRSCNALTARLLSQYVCDWAGPVPVTVESGATYTLFLNSAPNTAIASNSTGNFAGLNPGATYLVVASHPDCGQASAIVTLFPDNFFSIDFQLITTGFLENGVCKKGYHLSTSLTPAPDLAPVFNLTGGTFIAAGQDSFLNLQPGNWLLTATNYCVERNFNLPTWDAEISVQLPECPNGGCITLTGAKKQAEWEAWGAANDLTINSLDDFYIMDCPDFTGPQCVGSWDGSLCNLLPGSAHTVYLKPGTFSCPVDTATFILDPQGSARLDSVVVSNAVACTAGGSASITATVYGGKDPLYLEVLDNATLQVLNTIWDTDGDHNILIDNLLTGNNYLFRVVDDCGNSTDATASVIALPDVTASFLFQCPGTIRLFTNALFGATYIWRRADGTVIAEGVNKWLTLLPAPPADETFSVEIIFGNCPPHLTSIFVPWQAPVEVALSIPDTTICNADPFPLTALTGPGNYTFAWSNGTTDSSISVSGSGDYAVTATNSAGCQDSAAVSIALSPSLWLDFEKTDVTCFGAADGTANVSVTGGTAPFQFLWENGQNGTAASALPAGLSSVIASDAAGCVLSGEVEIFEPPLLTATAAIASGIACFGENSGSLMAQASGGTAPYGFLWSNSLVILEGPAPANLPAGTYALTATDANGCSTSAFVLLDQPLPLAVSLDQTDVNCFGETTGTLAAQPSGGTAPYGFLWSNSLVILEGPSINNLLAGTYALTLTDAQGCVLTASATLHQPALLTATAAASNVTCFGIADGTATCTSSGGVSPYQFLWNNGFVILEGATLADLSPGTYQLTLTDANGCTATAAASLTEPPLLTMTTSGSDIGCYNGADGSATSSPNGGTPPYNFLWDNDLTTQNIAGLGGGSYSLTVTDWNGCTAISGVEITAPPPLEGALSASSIQCFGGSVNLGIGATGGVPPFTGTGNFNLPAGNYTYLVSDQNGCTDTVSFLLEQPDLLIINDLQATDAGCFGESQGTIQAWGQGGTLPFSFAWSNGMTSDSLSQLPAGTYAATLTDANGCTATTEAVTLENFPALEAALTTLDASCFGESDGSALLENISGGSGAPYFLDSTTQVEAGFTLENLAAGIYQISLTDAFGCYANVPFEIEEPPLFSIQLPEEIIIRLGETIHLHPDIYGEPMEPIAWDWSPSIWLDCGDCPSPQASPLETIHYSVVAEDANGCRATDKTLVLVNRVCEVFVPNAFSPNGDGINDLLVLFAPPCVAEVRRWMIFDRWGSAVFSAGAPSGEASGFPANDPAHGWNGNFKGKPLNPAAFVWMAELLLTDGRTEVAKGGVVLMR